MVHSKVPTNVVLDLENFLLRYHDIAGTLDKPLSQQSILYYYVRSYPFCETLFWNTATVRDHPTLVSLSGSKVCRWERTGRSLNIYRVTSIMRFNLTLVGTLLAIFFINAADLFGECRYQQEIAKVELQMLREMPFLLSWIIPIFSVQKSITDQIIIWP